MGPDLVVVRKCCSRAEAEFARQLLESQGVQAMIEASDASGWWPGGVFATHLIRVVCDSRIMVRQEDKGRAAAILRELMGDAPWWPYHRDGKADSEA